MVLRVLYKRGVTPMSVGSTIVLNAIAFVGVLSILVLGLHILAPSEGLRPAPPKANLVHDRSFVVLSVDDFGRWTDSVPLFPDPQFMRNHSDLLIQKDYWYRSATVETRQDLQNLHTFLTGLNDGVSFEQRAVLTPHWIVGGPDFDAMRNTGCGGSPSLPSANATAEQSSSSLVNTTRQQVLKLRSSGKGVNITNLADRSAPMDASSGARLSTSTAPGEDMCQYKEQLLSDAGPTGLDQAPYHRGDLRDAYMSLWKSGLWHPEYHGRSHFSVDKWLRLLKSDAKTQACFDNNLVCATDITLLRSEFNGFSDKSELKTWLEGGVNAFSAFWGYRPALISSPHNTWSSWLADAAVDLSFVGAELAEDQANYVEHQDALSLHDRFRFDVFFPGFDCESAIREVQDLLRVPVEKSIGDLWYDFLSAIDLFRVHYRPYHHGSGGDHERFISLMWHAQNAMSSTYSPGQHTNNMQCLNKAVRTIRETVPRAVFVTGSEMHQIRSKGWSQEVWSDSVVLRNYATHAVDLTVPDLRDLHRRSSSWGGRRVQLTLLVSPSALSSVNGALPTEVSVGDLIRLQPDTVVRLSMV